MISEKERRRETGSFDEPVVFADGQTWFLPRPRVRVRPKIVGGKVEAVRDHTLGPEYLELLEDYYRAQQDETEGAMDRFNAALMGLTIALLRSNYNLTDDELTGLIYFDYSYPPDPVNEEFRKSLVYICLGLPQKKTSEDGSSPT